MPLVRFAVRNEYGLGVPELYKDAVQAEDPKAVLEGVTVAGLVGILRQLGDLAEFAAEIFHGLQEQVASTASRSRKLVTRVQRIEASLPQLEKAILSQTSHIHFAYTPGSEWHPRIRNEQNHFVYDDLPHFVMDSYEECREPPRLQLLDRFDAGGPGSCLKRYSDPTFFKRASASSEVTTGEKSQYEKKTRKSKRRRRSSLRSGSFTNYMPTFSGRIQLSPTGQRQSPLSYTGSVVDMSFRSGKGEQSDSLCSKDGMDFIECVCHPSTSIRPNNRESMESSTRRGGKIVGAKESIYLSEQATVSGTCSPVMETTVPHSSSTTWDEKLEMLQTLDMKYRIDDDLDAPKTFNLDEHGTNPDYVESMNQVDDLSEYGSTPQSIVSEHGPVATTVDMQDVSKLNFDPDEAVMRPINAKRFGQADDLSEPGSIPEPNVAGHDPETIIDRKFVQLSGLNYMIDEVNESCQKKFEAYDHSLEPGNVAHLPQVLELSRGEITSGSVGQSELLSGPVDSKLGRGEFQCVLHTNSGDSQVDTEGINTEPVNQVDVFSGGENTVTVIEWPQSDDFDSETDNFVDALNTIESESENDFEGQARKVVELFSSSRSEGEDTIINEQKVEMIRDQEFEDNHPSPSDGYKEDITDDLQHSQALVPSTGIEPLEHGQLSCDESAIEGWQLDSSAVNGSQRSAALLSSATVLSLEHSQSYCSELAVVQGKKLDDSACLLDDDYVHSNKLSSACIEYPEPVHSSVNESAAEGLKLDDSAYMLDDLQCSTDSLSSANIVSGGYAQPSCGELAVVLGQKLDDSECLPDEQSIGQTHLSFNVSTSEDQKRDNPPGLFDDAHCSTPSAAVESRDTTQSSSTEFTVAQSQKLEDSACVLDERPMTSNKSSLADFESLEHEESSCYESPAEGQKLDRREFSFDDTQSSTASLPLSVRISQEDSQLQCSESAVPRQKVDDSTCLVDEQLVEYPKLSSDPSVAEETDFSNHKPSACDIAAFSSHAPPTEGTSQTSHLPQEMLVGFSSTTPLAFWTNGNLLGLAPSKPTVLSVSSSVDSAPMNSGQFHEDIIQKVEGPAETQASSFKYSECSDSAKEAKLDIGNQDFRSHEYKGNQIAFDKHGRSLDHDSINLTDLSSSQGLTNVTAEVASKTEDSSSLLSFFGRGLLKNGLRRTGSFGSDENPRVHNPLNNKFATADHASFSSAAPETNLKRELDSQVNSPPPSPPLEHMKISFRPIDGFESSRLKLKYPEGVDHHESTIDIFPSFQLVPEPSNLKHDNGSDSDDDTFCRSYAGMSDDCLNHLSDSNSEEWESEDSSGTNNHDAYDSFHRISSTQSASSSPHCEEASHESIQAVCRSVDAMTLESGPTFDIPVLDTKNPFSFQEMKLSLHEEVNSSNFQWQMPQTPPLPPVQWRLSRSLSDAAEINQDLRSENLTQSFDSKISGYGIPHLAKVNSAEVPSRGEDPVMITKSKKKLDRQQQNSLAENGMKADERGDFLHQIRAKSFNLRRTETSRLTNVPSTAASNKVTAILQKANAIRRAVASDDGEDDSWSDA